MYKPASLKSTPYAFLSSLLSGLCSVFMWVCNGGVFMWVCNGGMFMWVCNVWCVHVGYVMCAVFMWVCNGGVFMCV